MYPIRARINLARAAYTQGADLLLRRRIQLGTASRERQTTASPLRGGAASWFDHWSSQHWSKEQSGCSTVTAQPHPPGTHQHSASTRSPPAPIRVPPGLSARRAQNASPCARAPLSSGHMARGHARVTWRAGRTGWAIGSGRAERSAARRGPCREGAAMCEQEVQDTRYCLSQALRREGLRLNHRRFRKGSRAASAHARADSSLTRCLTP